MTWLHRLLHLRAGEERRVAWVIAIGVAFAAATQIGDDVAQSVFVTRVGAAALPGVFAAKGVIDVLAAALYLPMTRGRGPTAVWLVAIAVYVAAVAGGGAWASAGGDAGAYGLYVAHECAWTILTIHWGVFILDAFDASQARRLFPLLFTSARVGGIVAGGLLGGLAGPLGPLGVLPACAGFAGLAGLLAVIGRPAAARRSPTLEQPDQAAAGVDDQPIEGGLLSTWRRAWRSPLLRAIAASTAAMVLLRETMHMVALGEIADYGGDPAGVARFLGGFGAAANAAAIVIGVLVVPRLLARAGVGAANLLYAALSAAAVAGLWLFPSLAAAAAARFTRNQLKDALKTPLSALFYGAEPPPARAGARATVFGVVIPLATAATAGFLVVGNRVGVDLVLGVAAAVAAVFVVASAVQNRRWRAAMVDLLRWKLARTPAADPVAVDSARAELAARPRLATADPALKDDLARGLASPDPRARAVAEELAAELARARSRTR